MATSKKSSSSKRQNPMVPKVGVKPKSAGGKRYGCGGKLK